MRPPMHYILPPTGLRSELGPAATEREVGSEYRARWPTKAARTEAWEEFNAEPAVAEKAPATSSSGSGPVAGSAWASLSLGDQARQPSAPAAAAVPASRSIKEKRTLDTPPPRSSRDPASATPSVPAAAASGTLCAAPIVPRLPELEPGPPEALVGGPPLCERCSQDPCVCTVGMEGAVSVLCALSAGIEEERRSKRKAEQTQERTAMNDQAFRARAHKARQDEKAASRPRTLIN